MNKARRKQLDSIHADIMAIREDEETALCNLPESLQDGEKGEKMQEHVDRLDEVLDLLSETIADA